MPQPKNPSTESSPSSGRLATAEKAARKSETIFRLLVDAVKDYAIFALDARGRILTWNTGAERLKGYRASEIVGEHFSKFYPPEDIARDHPQHELELARKEGRYEEEGWRIRKDGTRFWANVVINRLDDEQGNFIGFAKITRDLTERKRTEETLRQSEERIRLMIESVNDYAIFMLNPDGTIASWNAGAQRLKQYRADEIVGRHFSRFYTVEDLRAKKPERELEEAVKTGRFEDEGWRIRKDGSRFWANVVIATIRAPDGRLLGFSKVTRDLTERKQAEEELRRVNENLEERVRSRTAELTSLTERLKEAIRSRDEFMSIASHELNTPITSLKLQMQMRLRNFGREDAASPPLARLVKMVRDDERQINRLSRLVDDMLDITRISSTKLALRKERVDLGELVGEVAERFAPQFQEAGCETRISLAEGVVGVWDAYRIEQIITNLITNAIKYGESKPVEIRVARNGARAVFSVRDQGIGIAPEDHERVFRQFERAETASHVAGLGLGLYIVRQLVELHGGSIRLESQAGQGSNFVVELPLTS
jgi:PAS domain S-box-containing protein